MIEIRGQQGVLLAIISLVCLGCVFVFCLRCKKRAMMRQEDNVLYDKKEFNQHNSKSHKPNKEIRSNHVSSSLRQSTTMLNSPTSRFPTGHIHCSYQNIPNPDGTYEPTYVDPIPDALYANEEDADTGTYENVFPTKEIQHDSDSSYENTDFLNNRPDDDEYVNTMTEHN